MPSPKPVNVRVYYPASSDGEQSESVVEHPFGSPDAFDSWCNHHGFLRRRPAEEEERPEVSEALAFEDLKEGETYEIFGRQWNDAYKNSRHELARSLDSMFGKMLNDTAKIFETEQDPAKRKEAADSLKRVAMKQADHMISSYDAEKPKSVDAASSDSNHAIDRLLSSIGEQMLDELETEQDSNKNQSQTRILFHSESDPTKRMAGGNAMQQAVLKFGEEVPKSSKSQDGVEEPKPVKFTVYFPPPPNTDEPTVAIGQCFRSQEHLDQWCAENEGHLRLRSVKGEKQPASTKALRFEDLKEGKMYEIFGEKWDASYAYKELECERKTDRFRWWSAA